jgi:hypothetical protein
MAVMTRGDERGAAVAVGALEVRAGGERQPDDLDVATRAGEQERAVAKVVLGVDVGAGGDQDAGCLDAVPVGGRDERGAAARRNAAVMSLRRCIGYPFASAD